MQESFLFHHTFSAGCRHRSETMKVKCLTLITYDCHTHY